MTLLIGFGSKARNGKDTAADAIKNYYDKQTAARRGHIASYKGVSVGIFKFATALYKEVDLAIQGGIWSIREVTVDSTTTVSLPNWVQPEPSPQVSELAPYGKHPKLLQWWGTEFRRAQDPDYWVKKLFASIPANLDIALVSDVRFPNEADGIKQQGGYTVNVQRLRSDGSQYLASDRPANHPSEVALDGYPWDFYLKIPDGHAALTGEMAITLVEYIRGLN